MPDSDDLLTFRGEVSDAAIDALVALLIDNDERDREQASASEEPMRS